MRDPDDMKQSEAKKRGISRRQFLKNMGLSSVGVASITTGGWLERLPGAPALKPNGKLYGPEATTITLQVNGHKKQARVEPRSTLADVLRDQLGLTGTKIGCDRGACGACTVLLDGTAVTSCMTLALDAQGARIETVEGLAASVEDEAGLHPLQRAFVEYDALQCGFCTSGMIMSCKALLDRQPNPSEEEIRVATSGNLCRCGTYPKVFEAVRAAVDGR